MPTIAPKPKPAAPKAGLSTKSKAGSAAPQPAAPKPAARRSAARPSGVAAAQSAKARALRESHERAPSPSTSPLSSKAPAAGGDWAPVIARAVALLDRLEGLMPAPREPDWSEALAFRWRRRRGAMGGGSGYLQAVRTLSTIRLGDLRNIDAQKADVERNTRQFVQGRPANNVLMTGSRGTGKSSLVKACLNEFSGQGLRLIEVDKDDMVDLPDIVELVSGRPERFIVFSDDLSFEEGEPGYKALKTALDGSIAAQSDNVLIYATSNRRHLMPEYMSENLDARHQDGEIHPGETTEEKVSLSERFGLWIAFYPFRQDDYLAIAAHWLAHFGCTPAQIESARADALRFALERGSRSGRVAWQFARDWAGSRGRSAAGARAGRRQGA